MLTDILTIALITVIITDLSGFIPNLETSIAKWLKINKVRLPKILTCSLCQTHWLGLGYLIFTNQFTLLNYAVVLLIAYFTTTIKNVLQLIKDCIDNILCYIQDKLN